MSHKDLSIFKRNLKKWELEHPRILINNKRSIANFISAQTDRIIKAQLETADSIIVSQDRISSGIDEVAFKIDRVVDGLEGIASAFEWGFSELVWQLEQQRSILEDILKVLQVPLDTQAKELKKRAEEAYRYGWFDDALKDFLESEKKNRYDFTIHQYLGNIYLFEKKNTETALNYYEKTVKYAIPKSPYHSSFALLHIGLIRYLQEDFKKAYEATSKALELSPNLCEAHYQHAQYCTKLGKYNEAIEHIWKAIESDRYYCVKVNLEKDFDVMKKQLRSFFEELRNEAQSQAKSNIEIAEELVKNAESYGVYIEISDKFESSNKKLGEARMFLKRGSLFDCWDATWKAYVAQKMAADSSIEYLSDQIVKTEEEHKDNILKCRKNFDENIGISGAFIICMLIGAGLFRFWVWAEQANVGTILGYIPRILLLIARALILYIVIAHLTKNSRIKKLQTSYENEIAILEHSLSEVKTKWHQVGWYLEETENIEDAEQCEVFLRKKFG